MQSKLSSYFLTILSLSLVLFLLGLYGFLSLHSSNILDLLKEKINIVVELNEGASQSQVDNLLNKLKSNEAVVEESIEYLSEEDASKLMLGSDELTFHMDSLSSPFNPAVVFNLNAGNYNKEFLDKFSAVVNEEHVVRDVFYQEEMFDLAKSNIGRIGLILMIIGLLLLTLVIAMIVNTVNLSLMKDKQKIETMELVGAERDYIKKPYLLQALKTGTLSSALAIALLLLMLIIIFLNLPSFSHAISIVKTAFLVILILLLGVGIPYWATNRIVNRYLDKI